jgi:hypothetical protein
MISRRAQFQATVAESNMMQKKFFSSTLWLSFTAPRRHLEHLRMPARSGLSHNGSGRFPHASSDTPCQHMRHAAPRHKPSALETIISNLECSNSITNSNVH